MIVKRTCFFVQQVSGISFLFQGMKEFDSPNVYLVSDKGFLLIVIVSLS